jgi:hypothetical protein
MPCKLLDQFALAFFVKCHDVCDLLSFAGLHASSAIVNKILENAPPTGLVKRTEGIIPHE